MFTFERIDPAAEAQELIDFMTAHPWPYHVNSHPTVEQIRQAIGAGAYRDDENDSYWIVHRTLGRVGFVRLEDLEDPTPLFDLRLAEEHRGRGFGKDILLSITDWVFENNPQFARFEGQTREDNLPMRKTFVRAGWVKEAHYREGWPVAGGEAVASVAYAILRRDWETGVTTPVPWDDDPQ